VFHALPLVEVVVGRGREGWLGPDGGRVKVRGDSQTVPRIASATGALNTR